MPTTIAEARALEGINAIQELLPALEDAKTAVKAVLTQMRAVNDEYSSSFKEHLHALKLQERPHDLLLHGNEEFFHTGDVSLPSLRRVNGADDAITWHGGNLFQLEPEELTLD